MEARLIFMALICLCIAQMAFANEDNFPFQSQSQQQRFIQLSKQIRCSACQNQSVYDSNSYVATEMRAQIYSMLHAGKADAEILTHLSDKYGDFILFMPPWRSNTVLLWLGPLVMLGIAIMALRRYFALPKYALSV
jgi:cytochrome c-type biogenesis protein CcmH